MTCTAYLSFLLHPTAPSSFLSLLVCLLPSFLPSLCPFFLPSFLPCLPVSFFLFYLPSLLCIPFLLISIIIFLNSSSFLNFILHSSSSSFIPHFVIYFYRLFVYFFLSLSPLSTLQRYYTISLLCLFILLWMCVSIYMCVCVCMTDTNMMFFSLFPGKIHGALWDAVFFGRWKSL